MNSAKAKSADQAGLAARKKALRADAKDLRRTLLGGRDKAAARVAEVDLSAQGTKGAPAFQPGTIVAGFYPLPDEFDVLPLMGRFQTLGCQLALPVVEQANAPLVFRQWNKGDELVPGAMNIPVPPKDALQSRPDVLLVPFLLIDAQGYRLGYGGGFYDRTIAKLRQTGPVLTIAVGFSGQIVDKVPRDRFDLPVDAILTEDGLRLCPAT